MRQPSLAQVLPQLVGSRWRWMTLAALGVCAIVICLGFWQLDRLAQRHAESARRAQRLAAAPLVLDASGQPVGAGPGALILFQPVTVRGRFDSSQELALTNEVWQGELGIHLLTPLLLPDGAHAVLVDRGWIPVNVSDRIDWSRFRVDGSAEITGWVRPIERAGASVVPAGTVTPGGLSEERRLVPSLNVKDLQGRIGVPLLPFVVVQSPPAGQQVSADALPYRQLPETNLGDGVHLIAAVQWFIIAGIIVVGQVTYVRWQMAKQPPLSS
jgi:cytochrome oxidase assembly protein ShyY1